MPQSAEQRRLEREIDAYEGELTDLEAFARALAAVTSQTNTRGEIVGWAPEVDDGVLINLAPLWTLLPSWPTEPKQCWRWNAATMIGRIRPCATGLLVCW